MEIDTPESLNDAAPVVAADQAPEAVEPQHSASGASLQSIVQSHVETHTGFDPALHAVNEDGSPKRKADGSYAMKRGRKAGGKSSLPPKSGAAVAAPATPAETAPQVPRISPDEAARQSANLIINATVWICGEEIGAPKDKAESEGLLFSFKNYYESRGVPNIPPEMGLILGIGSYVVPRMREVEKKEGKISKIITAVKLKIAEMRG